MSTNNYTASFRINNDSYGQGSYCQLIAPHNNRYTYYRVSIEDHAKFKLCHNDTIEVIVPAGMDTLCKVVRKIN